MIDFLQLFESPTSISTLDGVLTEEDPGAIAFGFFNGQIEFEVRRGPSTGFHGNLLVRLGVIDQETMMKGVTPDQFALIAPSGRLWNVEGKHYIAWWDDFTDDHMHQLISKFDLDPNELWVQNPNDSNVYKFEFNQERKSMTDKDRQYIQDLRDQHFDALAKKRLRKKGVGKFGSAATAAKTSKAGYDTPAQFNSQRYYESIDFLQLFENPKRGKYMWNPRAKPTKNWGVRVYHGNNGESCINSETAETGDTPPEGYFQCARCFPRGSRRAREASKDEPHIGESKPVMVRAALRIPSTGKVLTGLDHYQIMSHPSLEGHDESDIDPGFVDQDGNFHTREEALKYVNRKRRRWIKNKDGNRGYADSSDFQNDWYGEALTEEYRYETCCVNADGQDIIDLQDTAEDIDRDEFLQYVDEDDLAEVERQLGYDEDFPMENDWHVSYHTGVYRGKPCAFFCHSRIEYIFT